MAFMQFDIEFLPAIIGAGIYIFYRLLGKAIAARPQNVPSKGSPSKVAEEDMEVKARPAARELTEEDLLEEDLAEEELTEEEPAVEPAAEPAPEAEVSKPEEGPAVAAAGHAGASRSKFGPLLWRALVVGLLLLLPELPTLLQSARGGLAQASSPAPLPPPSDEGAAASPEANCMGAGAVTTACPVVTEPAAEQATGELDASEPASEELVREAPLTVKLTRQAMNYDEADYIRSAYYGTLMVGTPPLEMTVVFDTGSGHLVLPSMYCRSDTCKVHTRYRRSGSTTGRDINTNGQATIPGKPRDSLTIAFGTGEISGVLVEDVICIDGLNASGINDLVSVGSSSNLGCMTLRFIAASALSEDPFKSFNFDGILGLGLEGLSQTRAFNFVEVMADSLRHLDNVMPHTFGVFLANTHLEDSEIALGGWTKAHLTEDLSWGPVHDPEMGHWIVPIRGIRVDGDRMDFCDDGSCRAAVDTGTSLLAVPTAAFREMYELLRHSAPLSGHCQGFGPLLHFELDHFTVTMGPRDYAQVRNLSSPWRKAPRLGDVQGQGHRHDVKCTPMLMTLDLPEPLGPKLFILGEPVLRKYYTVYDAFRKRVGFGRAMHARGPTRDSLLLRAPELDAGRVASVASGRRAQRMPTMFDVFRWRRALRR